MPGQLERKQKAEVSRDLKKVDWSKLKEHSLITDSIANMRIKHIASEKELQAKLEESEKSLLPSPQKAFRFIKDPLKIEQTKFRMKAMDLYAEKVRNHFFPMQALTERSSKAKSTVKEPSKISSMSRSVVAESDYPSHLYEVGNKFMKEGNESKPFCT